MVILIYIHISYHTSPSDKTYIHVTIILSSYQQMSRITHVLEANLPHKKMSLYVFVKS